MCAERIFTGKEDTQTKHANLQRVCRALDAILISTPFYGTITEHLGLYSDVKLYPIHLDCEVGAAPALEQLMLFSAVITGGDGWCFYLPLLGCFISRPVAKMADFSTSLLIN